MQTWIALFRGINVGGNHKVPMVQLASILESEGCASVRTYIQSGNVVFDCSSRSQRNLSQRIENAFAKEFGFRAQLFLLSKREFCSAMQNNPFAEAVTDPKTMHFFFLETSPDPSAMEKIADLAMPTEQFQLRDKLFYLHAPDGIGRSKLASRVEKTLGVSATARNFNTIQHLYTMLGDGTR